MSEPGFGILRANHGQAIRLPATACDFSYVFRRRYANRGCETAGGITDRSFEAMTYCFGRTEESLGARHIEERFV